MDIKSRAELREWLIQNHKTEKECWVVVKRGKPTDYGLHNQTPTLTNTRTYSIIFLQSTSLPFHEAPCYPLMKHCVTPS